MKEKTNKSNYIINTPEILVTDSKSKATVNTLRESVRMPLTLCTFRNNCYNHFL